MEVIAVAESEGRWRWEIRHGGTVIKRSDERFATAHEALQDGLDTVWAGEEHHPVLGILPDITERVLATLERHPGEEVCHACLAREIAVSYKSVQKAVVRLRGIGQVNVDAGKCSWCDRLRVTVGVRSRPTTG